MNKNTGFTLIEVLIAVVILAGGLLGLAALQATSLRNNQSAYNRSQATQLAYEMADRMRANVLGLAKYRAMGVNPRAATAKSACYTTGCSWDDMAENDLYEWNCAIDGGCPNIAATLPGGGGTASWATITSAAGVYTIAIQWDDDQDGDDTNNLDFQTSFQL
jgi:type IV pilus assembly protein PilV